VIGPAGSVKGDIVCKNADIEGQFSGKIQVAEILNIKSKATIQGDVICGKLSVEPGAEFSASCVMKPSTKTITSSNEQPKPEEK
jgi:cytoskeletal protein CcmA (bactofilin family)